MLYAEAHINVLKETQPSMNNIWAIHIHVHKCIMDVTVEDRSTSTSIYIMLQELYISDGKIAYI